MSDYFCPDLQLFDMIYVKHYWFRVAQVLQQGWWVQVNMEEWIGVRPSSFKAFGSILWTIMRKMVGNKSPIPSDPESTVSPHHQQPPSLLTIPDCSMILICLSITTLRWHLPFQISLVPRFPGLWAVWRSQPGYMVGCQGQWSRRSPSSAPHACECV